MAIIKTNRVTYTGLFAKDRLVDAQELWRSFVGIGRVANSITHFCLYGEVVKDSRLFRVRHYVGPPQENGVAFEIAALMAHGQLPIFAPTLLELAEEILPYIWAAVISKTTGWE